MACAKPSEVTFSSELIVLDWHFLISSRGEYTFTDGQHDHTS